MTTLEIIILTTVAVALIAYLVYYQIKREERAKKNMSFLESFCLTGIPIICFHNNDKVVNMILDSGANQNIIDSNYLPNLNYEDSETINGVIGIGGSSEDSNCVYLPLSYKDVTYTLECINMDMSSTVKEIKDTYGVTINGVLGTGFFAKYKYILDFDKMVAYSLRR